MATQEEIEKLKKEWLRDPCWDIEDTEGFEDHRAELVEFCDEWSKISKEIYNKTLLEKAESIGVPGNIELARYALRLEDMIDTLQNKVFGD